MSCKEVDEVLNRLFKEHNMRACAVSELHNHKQWEGEGMAEFISALQRIATKAYPEAPQIVSETIIECLKKGLLDEFHRNYIKT